MWKKILWGTSKRFANDVTNGVMKERNRQEKARILDKVEIYNEVSKHFYDRLNFIRDINDLISIVTDHYIVKNRIEETEQLLRLRNYYEKRVKNNLPVPPDELSGTPLEVYRKGLAIYSEIIDSIELWVFKKTYMKIEEDYVNGVYDDKEHKKEVDHLLNIYPYVNIENVENIYLWDIEEGMEKNFEEFIRYGDRVLEMLE